MKQRGDKSKTVTFQELISVEAQRGKTGSHFTISDSGSGLGLRVPDKKSFSFSPRREGVIDAIK